MVGKVCLALHLTGGSEATQRKSMLDAMTEWSYWNGKPAHKKDLYVFHDIFSSLLKHFEGSGNLALTGLLCPTQKRQRKKE